MESGDDLVSRAVTSQVPSTRRGLTAVFGMGTGGSLLPLSPEIVCTCQGFFQGGECRASWPPRAAGFRPLPSLPLWPSPGFRLPACFPVPFPAHHTLKTAQRSVAIRSFPSVSSAGLLSSRLLRLASALASASLPSLSFPWSQSFKSLRPGSSAFTLPSLSLRFTLRFPAFSDQALDRLVSSSSTPCSASTDDLSPHRL